MKQMSSYQKLHSVALEVLDNIKDQLAENERLKWMAVVLAAFLYVPPVFYLAEVTENSRKKYQTSNANLVQLVEQVSETSWPSRADNAQLLVSALENRLWKGNTPGLAEAAFERWIRTALEEQEIEVRQVLLTRRPVLTSEQNSSSYLSSLQYIRAKVLAPLDEAGLIKFLQRMIENDSWIVVEQLAIRPGRNARIEMDLMTAFRIPGEQG